MAKSNEQKVENMKKQSKQGGARPGAGRKPGKYSQKTLEKMKVLAAMRQRIMAKTDQLLNAQFSLAEGISYLFRIDEIKDEKGKVKKKENVLVTDLEEIKAYLDGDTDSDSYYYITTERPNNKAIDSLLDRTFGKSIQSVELSGEDGGPIKLSLTDIIQEIDGRTTGLPGAKAKTK